MNTRARTDMTRVTDPVVLARYRLVHDFPGGSEAMAPFLDLHAGTLRRKAHPDEHDDDLTVTQAIDAMNLAKDYRLLDAMALKCDRVVVEQEKQKPTGDQGLLEQFLDTEQSMGEFAGDIRKALEHKKLTSAEIAACSEAAHRLASHAAAMVSLLAALKDD